ncbi:MAG: PilZ domain-containing protein, partial [Bdellovibrionota bacterium]
MKSTAFYERRKQNESISFCDRRNGHRRKDERTVTSNKRRLAIQLRHYERLNFHIPIRLKLREKEISGHTSNISKDGLMVVCEKAVKIGTPLTLQFSFGESFCYMNIAGQVIFCSTKENGVQGRYAIGIRFSAIRDWEQKVLASAVQELNSKPELLEYSLLSVSLHEDDLALEAAKFHIEQPQV